MFFLTFKTFYAFRLELLFFFTLKRVKKLMHVRKFWFNFIELNPTVFLPFSKKPFINYDSEEYFEATLTEKNILRRFWRCFEL